MAAGNLAGAVLGYKIGSSLDAGFLGRAFFAVAGASAGGALAAYVTTKLGKDTA
jgi:outer membrane lipoprotein SlyB